MGRLRHDIRACALVGVVFASTHCRTEQRTNTAGTSSRATAPAAQPTPPECTASIGKRDVMCHVAAGAFMMGCNAKTDSICAAEGGFADEKPYHRVELSAFYIDRSEVTVAAYRACVAAGGCKAPDGLRHFSCTPQRRNLGHADRERMPMNCVRFADAAAYCAWAGKRLPTEAEWEKAARGTNGAAFPWGAGRTSCEYAIIEDACGLGKTEEVCARAKGNSPYGACDMIGNVKEWVSDRFDGAYYRSSPPKDPRGPSAGLERVVKGGSWRYDGINYLRASTRERKSESTAWDNLGFRCAVSDRLASKIDPQITR